MTSIQSTFISPLTRVLRIRHYLWYAHTSNNIYLQISRALTNGIITSTPGSCPIKGRKVYPIGQAVDSKVFNWDSSFVRNKKESKNELVDNLSDKNLNYYIKNFNEPWSTFFI